MASTCVKFRVSILVLMLRGGKAVRISHATSQSTNMSSGALATSFGKDAQYILDLGERLIANPAVVSKDGEHVIDTVFQVIFNLGSVYETGKGNVRDAIRKMPTHRQIHITQKDNNHLSRKRINEPVQLEDTAWFDVERQLAISERIIREHVVSLTSSFLEINAQWPNLPQCPIMYGILFSVNLATAAALSFSLLIWLLCTFTGPFGLSAGLFVILTPVLIAGAILAKLSRSFFGLFMQRISARVIVEKRGSYSLPVKAEATQSPHAPSDASNPYELPCNSPNDSQSTEA